MANIATRFFLGAAWLPVAAMAQAQAPLTGSMASPVVSQVPAATDATASMSQARAASSTASSAASHARNFSATWAVEVPMRGQTPRAVSASSTTHAVSGSTTPAYPSSSPAQVYPVSAMPTASRQQHALSTLATSGVAEAGTPAADAAPSNDSAPPRYRVGDDTRALMAEQANGTYAGHQSGMLGAAASLSYQRYLNSFKQPIPQWFKQAVKTNDSGGN